MSAINMKKYSVIYADPPWTFQNKYTVEKRPFNYNTMTLQQIKNLSVTSICKEDALLFIWTTDAHIPSCLEIINAWGFNYSTIAFVWHKLTKAGKEHVVFGRWNLKSCELCLLGTKGHPSYLRLFGDVRQFIEAPIRRHSQKPNEIADRISYMTGYVPRIELFARDKKPGWDVWGNEIVSDIKL